MDKIRIGVVTTSDRASQGIYEDISGVAIMDTMKEYLLNECEYEYRCIPDDQNLIENTLIELARDKDCDLIVTTGGTGPAPRDVTTEARITSYNVCYTKLLRKETESITSSFVESRYKVSDSIFIFWSFESLKVKSSEFLHDAEVEESFLSKNSSSSISQNIATPCLNMKA